MYTHHVYTPRFLRKNKIIFKIKAFDTTLLGTELVPTKYYVTKI